MDSSYVNNWLKENYLTHTQNCTQSHRVTGRCLSQEAFLCFLTLNRGDTKFCSTIPKFIIPNIKFSSIWYFVWFNYLFCSALRLIRLTVIFDRHLKRAWRNAIVSNNFLLCANFQGSFPFAGRRKLYFHGKFKIQNYLAKYSNNNIIENKYEYDFVPQSKVFVVLQNWNILGCANDLSLFLTSKMNSGFFFLYNYVVIGILIVLDYNLENLS